MYIYELYKKESNNIHSQGTKHGEENHIINTTKHKRRTRWYKRQTTKLDEWRTPKRNNWGSLNKNRVFRKFYNRHIILGILRIVNIKK
jgi:hypothetical protein